MPAAAFSITPSPDIAQSGLWDETVRDAVRKPKYKKKDLDHRRSKVWWSIMCTLSPHLITFAH